MLCFVQINSVLLNLLSVWISYRCEQVAFLVQFPPKNSLKYERLSGSTLQLLSASFVIETHTKLELKEKVAPCHNISRWKSHISDVI